MSLSGLFYPWGFILQAVAILHFVRRRPETYWLWIILIGGGLGALVYIAAEVAPDASLLRGAFDAMGRRRRIRDLEATVLDNPSVGNLEELADQYLDDGRFARARAVRPGHRVGACGLTPSVLSSRPRRSRARRFHGRSGRSGTRRVEGSEVRLPSAIGLLAHAHARAGDPDKADALFRDATAISTLSETYYNYATFLAGRQRKAEAREWAGRILAKKPTMPRYLRRRERRWFRKARALLKQLPA
jgi:hypothetical protein